MVSYKRECKAHGPFVVNWVIWTMTLVYELPVLVKPLINGSRSEALVSSILLISHGFHDLQLLCSMDDRCLNKSSP